MVTTHIDFAYIDALVTTISEALLTAVDDSKPIRIYGIPRGGVPVAYALSAKLHGRGIVVNSPLDADVIVDDLIDSGKTMQGYLDMRPHTLFAALLSKQTIDEQSKGRILIGAQTAPENWIIFPWEGDLNHSAEDIPRRLLQFIGEDVTRGGLIETPHRFLKAWKHWTSGYGADVKSILKVFEDGAEGCDQMVVRKDIPLYSKCEHHLADIVGTCTIAYIPNGKVLGLSKLDRLVDVYARRLQVQERLTNQIADALWEHVSPKGVGVWINARHMCVESRGVQHVHSATITTALRGCILTEDSARAEFLALARS